MAMKPRDDRIANDRLLAAFLAASVVVVLIGWLAMLAYLGFRIL